MQKKRATIKAANKKLVIRFVSKQIMSTYYEIGKMFGLFKSAGLRLEICLVYLNQATRNNLKYYIYKMFLKNKMRIKITFTTSLPDLPPEKPN